MAIKKRLNGDIFVNFFNTYKALVIMIILAIVVSMLTPKFLTVSNVLNILRQVSIYAILATGYTMIISAGCIDLSVEYILAIVGLVIAKLIKQANWPIVPSFMVGIAVGVICEYINSSIFLKFKLPPFIVTLGLSQGYRGIAQIICNGTPIAKLPAACVFIGQGYLFGIPFPIYIMVAMILIGNFILKKTIIGRRILAVGGNSEAAFVSGINVNRAKKSAYIILGIATGIAAIVMNGRVASAQPGAGAGMSMDCIAAVVIGGTRMGGGYGNVLGTLFGCLLVGVINNSLNLLNVNAWWQWVAKGLLIVIAVVLDSVTEDLRKKNQSK